MSHVTTHVLDTALGRPAAGVTVVLEAVTGEGDTAGDWRVIGTGVTDADGRVRELGPDALPFGHYRIRFDTRGYFAASSTAAFFPEVVIPFLLAEPDQHYHVPLLLSPFAYSTYRGS